MATPHLNPPPQGGRRFCASGFFPSHILFAVFLFTGLLLPLAGLAADTKSKAPEEETITLPPEETDDFSGYWLSNEGGARFTLTLMQQGDALTGGHSFVSSGGGDTDYGPAGETPSLTGQANGDSAVVRFKSGMPGSSGYGHARILLRGRYIYWTKMDETGDNHLPDHAVLIRQEAVQ